MARRLYYLFVLILVLTLSSVCFAQTFLLKTGDKVEGNLVERTDKYIKVEFAGANITYYLDEIDSINGEKIISGPADNIEPEVNFTDTNTAVIYWKDKIRENPKDFGAYNNLGMIYASLGQYEEAINYFTRAVEINPNFGTGFSNLGQAFNSLGQPDKALGYLRRALKLNPNSAQANNNLGHVYIDLGQFDEALPFCRKAVTINPDYADAYSNLGFIYVSMQKFELGIENLKKAVQKNPKDCISLENLGYVYFLLNRNQEARENFIKAKALYSDKSDSQGLERVSEFLEKLP